MDLQAGPNTSKLYQQGYCILSLGSVKAFCSLLSCLRVKDERSCPILLKLQRAVSKKRSRAVNVVIHCNALRLSRLPRNSIADA
ncbi:hypothetical protein TNCV_2233341 [Trichonephila clavipes]|nr:hypothetical protein TNCV_2233341 [Trichonephila clavipes]